MRQLLLLIARQFVIIPRHHKLQNNVRDGNVAVPMSVLQFANNLSIQILHKSICTQPVNINFQKIKIYNLLYKLKVF